MRFRLIYMRLYFCTTHILPNFNKTCPVFNEQNSAAHIEFNKNSIFCMCPMTIADIYCDFNCTRTNKVFLWRFQQFLFRCLHESVSVYPIYVIVIYVGDHVEFDVIYVDIAHEAGCVQFVVVSSCVCALRALLIVRYLFAMMSSTLMVQR